jgi:hypothetical protein
MDKKGGFMKKSLMISGMNFGTEFLTNLYKEVVKRGGTEDRIFESLKTGSDLIPKFAEMIVGAKKFVLKSLKVVVDNIFLKTDSFSKNSFFDKSGSVKLYFGSNFSNWILEDIPDVIPAFEGNLLKTQLTKYMYDSEILDELGQPRLFTISEFSAIIRDLLLKQPDGEDGILLNNGYANIFFIQLKNGRVVAVHVHWFSDCREWGLNARGLGGDRWFDGICVFSCS